MLRAVVLVSLPTVVTVHVIVYHAPTGRDIEILKIDYLRLYSRWYQC